MTTPTATPLKSYLNLRPSLSSSTAGPRSSLLPLTPSAHSQHQQSLQDMYSVLADLTHEFRNSGDECQAIAKLLLLKKELSEMLKGKQGAMRDLIAALCSNISQLAAATSQPPAVELQQQQQTLQQQKSVVTTQINTLLLEIERLESVGRNMEKQKAMLIAQKAESEAAKAKKIPSMTGTMGLYRNFSCIGWDYDAPSSIVKGQFHLSDRVKAFEYDRSKMSDFEIANQLWSQLE